MQHDFFWSCHVIGTDVGIIWCHQHCQRNHYISYIKTIEVRGNMTFLSCDTIAIVISITWHHEYWCHMMPIGISVSVTWCLQQHKWYHYILGQVPLVLASASHAANSFANDTIVLFRSRWSKWSATWPYWSCGTIENKISITQCWWHCQ